MIPALLALPFEIGRGAELVMYALPVVGSVLLFYGLYQVWEQTHNSNRKKLQDRLRGHSAKPDKVMETILRRGAMQQHKTFADQFFGKLSFIPKIQTMLDQADVAWSASQFLLNVAAAAIILAVALGALGINLLAAAGCGVAVLLLPLIALNFKRRARIAKLTRQLPDVFEMMGQALRAGHSLGGAIQLVHEQMASPVATEFGQVYHEQNLGVKVEDALQSMANRVDSMDVRFFVTAVVIQRQTGGDLAEVLDNISAVIRERIELHGLVRGLTAEGRLSGWVLFALPFIVLAGSLVLNPGYSNALFEDPRGKLMFMTALGMQLMGLAMIRWIVNIKV
jgi:tight adherence protein B